MANAKAHFGWKRWAENLRHGQRWHNQWRPKPFYIHSKKTFCRSIVLICLINEELYIWGNVSEWYFENAQFESAQYRRCVPVHWLCTAVQLFGARLKDFISDLIHLAKWLDGWLAWILFCWSGGVWTCCILIEMVIPQKSLWNRVKPPAMPMLSDQKDGAASVLMSFDMSNDGKPNAAWQMATNSTTSCDMKRRPWYLIHHIHYIWYTPENEIRNWCSVKIRNWCSLVRIPKKWQVIATESQYVTVGQMSTGSNVDLRSRLALKETLENLRKPSKSKGAPKRQLLLRWYICRNLYRQSILVYVHFMYRMNPDDMIQYIKIY